MIENKHIIRVNGSEHYVLDPGCRLQGVVLEKVFSENLVSRLEEVPLGDSVDIKYPVANGLILTIKKCNYSVYEITHRSGSVYW